MNGLERRIEYHWWDFSDRVVITGTLVSGCLVYAESFVAAGIIVWISVALVLRSIFLTAPAVRIGLHWRACVLYFITISAAIVLAIRISHPDMLRLDGMLAMGIIMIILSLLSIPLYVFFPRPAATEPVGPYKLIGSTSFIFNLDPKYKNLPENAGITFDRYNTTLPVQVWFPMEPAQSTWGRIWEEWVSARSVLWTSGCPGEEYSESSMLLHHIASNYRLPHAITGHLSLARTNSLWQKDMSRILHHLPSFTDSKGSTSTHRFPIAIYSHGMYGWRQIHTSLCESLASLGFIVIACDHAPDGMVSRPINGTPADCVPFDFHVPAGAEGMKEREFYCMGFQRRVRDMTGLLDHITSGAMETRFPSLKDKLSYDHICLWGHSFGGGTVMSTTCKDSRPARVATLDGWMYPMPDSLRKRGIQRASILNLTSHLWEFGGHQVLFRREVTFKNPEAHPKFDLVFKGTAHQNYCQTHFIAHKALLRRSKVIGPDLDPHYVISVLDYLVAAFFLAPKPDLSSEGTPSSNEVVSDVVVQTSDVDVSDVNDKHVVDGKQQYAPTITHKKALLVPMETEQPTDSMQEIPITQQFLKFLQSDRSITGHSLHLPRAIKSAVLDHFVHEQELEGFANPATYERVEKFLQSQQ